ncbi:MAG: hypothetical protein VB078_08915 [Clostridiaceae bacterium]|nr:hypothetical protein [Clostridiaceae bacterium]
MIAEQINKLRTSTLFRMIFKTPDIREFIKENSSEMNMPPFSSYIAGLCDLRGEAAERIIKRANIERSFGHQIFKGTRNPSRDTVLQLAFGFEADVEMAQELLKHACMSPLYPRVKRDAAIIHCLYNGLSIIEAQNVLHDMRLPLIGGGKTR